jgi:hypothetical protein
MKRLLLTILVALFFSHAGISQTFTYSDSWDQEGFVLRAQSSEGIDLNYSVTSFIMDDLEVRGEAMKHITMANHFLPNDAGAPDLPGSGRYIALPQGARAEVRIVASRTEHYRDVNISPAPRIPKQQKHPDLQCQCILPGFPRHLI